VKGEKEQTSLSRFTLHASLPVELPQDLELGQDDRLLDARSCR
jgi:hypothetical protein